MEDKCQRCGRCCYAKLLLNDKVYYTPYPCKYLDTQTKLCKVYEKRREVNPDCISVEEGIKVGVFPGDCPYVEGIKGYRPPIEHCLDENVTRLIEDGVIEGPDDLPVDSEALPQAAKRDATA